MLDLLGVEYYNRHKELLRQAQEENFIRDHHPKPSGSQTLFRQALVHLGRWLVIWGWRLHAKGIASIPSRA